MLLWSGDGSFVCLLFTELQESVLRVLRLILAMLDTCISTPRAFPRSSDRSCLCPVDGSAVLGQQSHRGRGLAPGVGGRRQQVQNWSVMFVRVKSKTLQCHWDCLLLEKQRVFGKCDPSEISWV